MESFVIANGVAFRYFDSGKGDKTVVLIHGYLESMECWDKVLSPLTKLYRVVAFDVPGHGISEVKGETHTPKFVAETLAALLKKIGVEKSSVIGHSMGGYIALAFAKEYPDMVDKLVLHHSTPQGDTPEKRTNRTREIEAIKAGKKELLSTINPGRGFAAANRKKFAEEIGELSEQIMMTEDEGIIALLNGMMEREDTSDIVESLGARAMLIFGADDSYMPKEYCVSLAETFTQAKVVEMLSSGHNSHIEEPEKFVEEVSIFIG